VMRACFGLPMAGSLCRAGIAETIGKTLHACQQYQRAQ
jgi:hypothetical protein